MAEKEYIEREALCYQLAKQATIDGQPRAIRRAAKIVIDFPAADVRPVVRGKWEEVEVVWLADIEDQPDAIASMFCPKCKRFSNHVYHYGDPTHGMNYCPNCGAVMEES